MAHLINRILVVDDETEFVNTVIRHLKREGFYPDSATNGKNACDKMKKMEDKNTFYDLVITDVVMPEMDGISLMEWIHRTYPATSVMVVTEFGDVHNFKKKMRPKLDEICIKPMTPDSMMKLIVGIQKKRSSCWQPWKKAAV